MNCKQLTSFPGQVRFISNHFIYAPLTSLLVPQQVVFEIIFVNLFALTTNIHHRVSEVELHAVRTEVCVYGLMCVPKCVLCAF